MFGAFSISVGSEERRGGNDFAIKGVLFKMSEKVCFSTFVYVLFCIKQFAVDLSILSLLELFFKVALPVLLSEFARIRFHSI